MQWWNAFVTWIESPAARPAIFHGCVLAVAVLIAALIASLIARGTVRGMLNRQSEAQKSAAIAALVDAATEASIWNSLTPGEQVLSDRAVGQADIQVRLLPIANAAIAANWAGHQLAELKRASATFGYQLEPAVAEFRDRMLEWKNKPHHAKRLFLSDLERWRFESNDSERGLVAQQDAWVATQHHERYAAPEGAAAATAAVPTYAPRQAAPASASAPAQAAPATATASGPVAGSTAVRRPAETSSIAEAVAASAAAQRAAAISRETQPIDPRDLPLVNGSAAGSTDARGETGQSAA